ncbi:MAG: hypothetical protein ACTHXA_00915 [Gulosibacter sp.]|uniref:hypothetical protein n=1 Tax=Gulosibacter sp. TaxID=2817531 RepID=UPI003F8F74AB
MSGFIAVALASSPGEIIMSGQLLVALPLALLAGLVSFASSCILPVVPRYLGLVGAVSGQDAGSGKTPVEIRPQQMNTNTVTSQRRVALGATLFALGLGRATKTLAWLRPLIRTIHIAGGTLLIVIGGLMVTGGSQMLPSAVAAMLPGYLAPI